MKPVTMNFDCWDALGENDLAEYAENHVGAGWVPLIEELGAALVALNPDIVVEQIKEKFGTLRFYVRDATPAQKVLVAEYQRYSGSICEMCGDPNKAETKAWNKWWIKTLCPSCAVQRYGGETAGHGETA